LACVRLGGYSSVAFVGTPQTIADEMEQWHVDEGSDFFNVMFPYLPGGLDDFVDRVAPELQRRGVFRREYEGETLRENQDRRCQKIGTFRARNPIPCTHAPWPGAPAGNAGKFNWLRSAKTGFADGPKRAGRAIWRCQLRRNILILFDFIETIQQQNGSEINQPSAPPSSEPARHRLSGCRSRHSDFPAPILRRKFVPRCADLGRVRRRGFHQLGQIDQDGPTASFVVAR
jgi:hypothetical protein